MQFLLKFILMIFITAYAISCSNKIEASKPLIITSVSPIADLIKNVAGSDFNVKALLKPGSSPHTFDPGSEEMRMIEKCVIYMKTGLSLELERIIDRLVKPYSRIQMIELKNNVSLIYLNENPHERNPSADPHIWVSPKNAVKIINTIQAELSRLYPDKKELFEKNTMAYEKELISLDQMIQQTVHLWKHKNIVEMHPAWGYFARDYGLNIVGIIQKHAGHEENFSLKDFQELLVESKKQNAFAVLIEPQLKNETAKKISSELGLGLITVDPEGLGAANYVDFIRANLKEMEKVLK